MQQENSPQPALVRRVTKNYVYGVIFFALFAQLALTIACWGLGAFYFNLVLMPESSSAASLRLLPYFAVALSLAVTAAVLWQAALRLLQVNTKNPWALVVLKFGAVCLIMFGFRVVAGVGVLQALDPLTILPALGAVLMFLTGRGVLLRQIYTAKQRPLWPWEKRDARTVEAQRLQEMWDRS